MEGPAGGQASETAHRLPWRMARLQLGVAVGWLVLAVLWWFVDDATWQPPVWTFLGGAYAAAAVVNYRQQRRARAGGTTQRPERTP